MDARRVNILINGRPAMALEGQSVAAALVSNGMRALRSTYRKGRSRGMFCGIGVCFDCVLTVDDRVSVRACLEPVREGMRIDAPEADS